MTTFEEERHRIHRILVDEIVGNIQSKAVMLTIDLPQEQKEKQSFGFDCQISALVGFATLAFGYKHKDFLSFCIQKCKYDVSNFTHDILK